MDTAMVAKRAEAGSGKIAMFDEVNEGTAIYKVVSRRNQAPNQGYWLALDGDGLTLPSDWYMRISGQLTNVIHGLQARPPTAFPFVRRIPL